MWGKGLEPFGLGVLGTFPGLLDGLQGLSYYRTFGLGVLPEMYIEWLRIKEAFFGSEARTLSEL